MSFHILGTGSYVPPVVVTNDDLAKIVETNDEWITTRTGIRRRHVAVDETTSEMAAKAASAALENSGVSADELDLILCATVSGDYICPNMACLVQRAIGAACPAFDLNGACSAFLLLLETAAAYLSTGRYRKILCVGAEQMSRILDWTDRSTCILFGDGAAGVVLEPGENYLGSQLVFRGSEELLNLPTSTGTFPGSRLEAQHPYVYMNGSEVYKFATRIVPQAIQQLLDKTGIEAAARRLKDIADEKFLINIEDYGNTSAASIPLLLDECNRAGTFKKGDLIVLAAFGGGLSCVAALIRW